MKHLPLMKPSLSMRIANAIGTILGLLLLPIVLLWCLYQRYVNKIGK